VVNNKVAFAAVAVLPISIVSSLDAAYARLLAGAVAVVLDDS